MTLRLIGIIIAFALPAVAGEDNDRAELMSRIEDKVHAIATALDGVAATPKFSGADDALARSREMRALVTQLAAIKGDHGRSNEITDHYPGYADAVDAAVGRLKHIWQVQARVEDAAKRCAKDDQTLHMVLEALHTKPGADPEADLAKLSALGDVYGQTWTAAFAELGDIDRAVAADVVAAHLGLTDSYWMLVSSNADVAAHALAARWTERYQAATAACEQLRLGVMHQDLAPALDELTKRSAAARLGATQLVHDYNGWLQSVRALRDLAVAGRTSIRDELCKATDDELPEQTSIASSSVAKDLGDNAAAASAQAAELRTRATDKTAQTVAVLDGLRASSAIIAEVQRNEAQGRSNAKLRAVLTAIKHRRDDAVRAAACTYKDTELPATDCHGDVAAGPACRAACLKVKNHTCTVIELTPDGDRGAADGAARGARDVLGFRAWFTRDQAELFTRYPALRECVSADKTVLELASTVAGYATCTKITPADFGDPLVAVTPDLPQ